MKVSKKILSIFVLAFVAMSTNLMAQTEMVWDFHGIGFTVPDDFQIEANNQNNFSAGNDAIHLSLQPWQDVTVTEDQLADAIVDVAAQMGYDNLHALAEVNSRGLVGYALLATIDGVNSVVAMFLDPETSTNLIVSVAFADGWENVADDICESIHTY